MNRHDMKDDDLQRLLQEQPPKPEADTKARHIAAAMAAFVAQQNTQSAGEKPTEDLSTQLQTASEEKKSTIVQGFLQRLRLTRDTNHHGDTSMNSTLNNPSFNQRPFWQKPALISGIAASSLAVLAGLTFMQHLMINSDEQELAARIAEQSLNKSVPLNVQEPVVDAEVEEIVVTGIRESLQQPAEVKRTANASVDAVSEEDFDQMPEASVSTSLHSSRKGFKS